MSDSQPQSPHGLRSAGSLLLRSLRDYRWLLAAMLLAALFEAVVIARSPVISRDGVNFIRMAQQLPDGLREAFRTHDQHPGYPATILAIRQLLPADRLGDETGQWILAARLSTALCGVLLVAVVWAISRELFHDPVPNVAAMVAATLPVLRQNAADALSDTPHLLLWLTACLLACVAVRRWEVRWFAAAGFISALAYWVRPEGLSVALVLCAAAPLIAWRTRATSLPRMALCVTTAAVVAVVTIAPYSLLSSKLLTSKQDPMAKAEPVLPYVVRQARADARSVATPDTAASEPASARAGHLTSVSVIARTFGDGVVELVGELIKALRYVYVPIFLLGCLFVASRRPPLAPFVIINLLGLLHATLLMHVYFMSGYISHRHVLPIIALAIPACAVGLTHLGVWIGARLSISPRRGVAVAALLFTSLVTPWSLRQLNYTYDHVLEAAQWIDSHAPPGAVVASNSSLVPFYAHRSEAYRDAQAPTVDVAIRADAAHRCDYVVVDELIEYFNPAWHEQLAANFTLVKEITPPHGAGHQSRTTIYAARPAASNTSRSRPSDTDSHGRAPNLVPATATAISQRPVATAPLPAGSASL